MMKSEKEKMLAGELYNASDPVLVAERLHARTLTYQLNVTHYKDEIAYRRILSELLPNVTSRTLIEPPFYCDYGYNIYAGENLFFNFNCVLLDVMPIRIGSNVMFGPNVQLYTATHPLDATKRRRGDEFAKPIKTKNQIEISAFKPIKCTSPLAYITSSVSTKPSMVQNRKAFT